MWVVQGDNAPMLSPILRDFPDVIETERLTLRSAMPGDGPAFNAAMVATWDTLQRYLPWARDVPTVAKSEEKVRELRAGFIARTNLPMLMILRATGALIGSTGLHRMDWSVPRFEVGYWLGKAYEGHGYVSEAVRALTALAFRDLAAARVELHCDAENEKSRRVAERCGFVLEGCLRNHSRGPTGELRDTVVYTLVPSDEAALELIDEDDMDDDDDRDQ